MKWEIEESPYAWLPNGEYFRSTGVFRAKFESGVEIAGVSANSWEEYWENLDGVSPTDKYIVSPELITCAGMRFEDLRKNEDVINGRIEKLIDLSNKFSDSYFLLGTPLFVNEKPKNSVLVIRSGEIIGATNKRYGATNEENEFFEMLPEESPMLLPNTNTAIVICSDLVLASLYAGYSEEMIGEILRVSGKNDLKGKKLEVLPDNVESVLLVSCWSVGGRFVSEGQEDDYYRNQLRNITWRLMRETTVKEVMVVDRVPTNLSEEQMKLTPTKPYNGVIRSK